MTKKCTKCLIEKSLEEFGKHPKGKKWLTERVEKATGF